MKLFNLHKMIARLYKKNDRTETHGDESVPAFDLDFEFETSNDFLNLLSPGLKEMFFVRPESPDLADTEDHRPLLRCALLGQQEIASDWVNCRLVIHREGLTEDRDLVIGDAKIKRVRFLALQGGSVRVRFQAQFEADELTKEEIGDLTFMVNAKGVQISLTRPLDDEAAQPSVLDNKPEQNPLQRAANDEPDEDEDDEDHPGNRAPAPARAGRGRGR